jgi:thiamine kinase-like enzyme
VGDVLTLDGLTPDRLTASLRRNGHVTGGRIEQLAVESSRTTLISAIARLRLQWSDDAAGRRPARLFLKMSRPDQHPDVAASALKEVAFYDTVAPLTPPGIVPHCYDALRDPASSAFHLVLEDLGETHDIVSEWPLPPTMDQCERIIDLYARFHAAWWDDPRLGAGVGTFMDDADVVEWLGHYQRRFAGFVDRLGDRLPPERRRIFERVLASWSKLQARYRSGQDLTVVHGDAHVWNVMYPREPAADTLRLIDWDAWRPDVATRDLAYMMAVHWYPERRRRVEAPLLRRYREGLARHGVTGYSFEALWQDYRLSVIRCLAVPVWQSSVKIGPWVWWSHLERVLQAFDDLGCEELLE